MYHNRLYQEWDPNTESYIDHLSLSFFVTRRIADTFEGVILSFCDSVILPAFTLFQNDDADKRADSAYKEVMKQFNFDTEIFGVDMRLVLKSGKLPSFLWHYTPWNLHVGSKISVCVDVERQVGRSLSSYTSISGSAWAHCWQLWSWALSWLAITSFPLQANRFIFHRIEWRFQPQPDPDSSMNLNYLFGQYEKDYDSISRYLGGKTKVLILLQLWPFLLF